jgi:hypothetical protein
MKEDPQLVVGELLHHFLQLPFFTREVAQWLLETSMANKDANNTGLPCHRAPTVGKLCILGTRRRSSCLVGPS